jgi:release factor glutamine methyltransferase
MEEAGLSWRELWIETTGRLGDPMEARWVCEHASGLYGLQWVLGLDSLAGERALHRLDLMVARRVSGEPLQYVLGTWAFRRLELMVDRRVLIPRPETEEVVEAALALARAMPRPLTLVDLGTGTGAIALSLASELSLSGVTVWATDASGDALDVARANLAGAGRAAANVRIAQGSWFDALPTDLRGAIDLVVSNPPYIANDDELPAEVRDWEPVDALLAGSDGLDAYRVIVPAAAEWLRPGGWLVLEVGAAQGSAVADLLRECDLDSVEVRRDAAGHQRIALGCRRSALAISPPV